MNQNLHKFHEIIEYIEQHLLSDIDAAALARMANLSVYEFRRVFPFLQEFQLGNISEKGGFPRLPRNCRQKGLA